MGTKRVLNSKEEKEQLEELRRGPWTQEEDTLLSNYITFHGEGRWNLLAKSSGLKRTGKSCRLRWLNYLKPDIKRGNLTPKEQILILELHSKWGNRWSKIAQHLPGRTDNEIKNYWRTRVQKQARQLKIDSNSKKFLEALRRFWMPRLREKIEQNSPSPSPSPSLSSTSTMETQDSFTFSPPAEQAPMALSPPQPIKVNNFNLPNENPSSSICSSDSMSMPQLFENLERPNTALNNSPQNGCYYVDISSFDMEGFNQADMSDEISASDCQMAEIDWMNGDADGTFWDLDELWQIRN
ncbi:hypothetical protein LguiA_000587 [Lonicera macranthoides]